MSSPPSTRDSPPAATGESTERQESEPRSLERIAPSLAGPVRRTGFWAAIVLPFLYLPLLANGLSTAFETAVFLGVLAINLVALYVGHAHRR